MIINNNVVLFELLIDLDSGDGGRRATNTNANPYHYVPIRYTHTYMDFIGIIIMTCWQ